MIAAMLTADGVTWAGGRGRRGAKRSHVRGHVRSWKRCHASQANSSLYQKQYPCHTPVPYAKTFLLRAMSL
eukprot:1767900-Rhodomonas_salina.2